MNSNPATHIRVLHIDDDPSDREMVRSLLEGDGISVASISTLPDIKKQVDKKPFDAIVSDLSMGIHSGRDVIDLVKNLDLRVPVIILTGTGSEELAVKILQHGAADYILKRQPHIKRLPQSIRKAIEIARSDNERRKAEAELLENEKRLRSLFENMLDGFAYCKMIFTDGQPEDFEYLYVNPAFEALTGLKNVVGRRVSEVIPGLQEIHPELFAICGRVALTGKSERFERYLKPLEIWLSISAYSTEQGYFAAVFDNISERKRAEKKNLEIVRTYAVLSSINQLIVRERDEQKIFEQACQIAIEVGGFRMSWIGLLNEQSDRVEPEAVAGVPESEMDKLNMIIAETCSTDDPVGQELRQGRLVTCADIEHDDRFVSIRDLGRSLGWRSTASFPLRISSKTVGVISYYCSDIEVFDEKEVRLLEELAMDLSFALESLHIDEQRRKAEEALQESEQRLNFHMNNSPMATVEWDSNFIVTRWAGEAEQIFGWSQAETIGKPIMDLHIIYGEDIPIVQKTMERLTDGSSKHVVSTNHNCTKDGKILCCEWYNSVLSNAQGKMVSVMSQVLDITERKRMEQHLEEERNLLRTIIDAIPDEIAVKDMERRFILVNPGTVRALKRSSVEEIIGKRDEDLIPKPFALHAKEEEEMVLATGRSSINKVGKSRINPSTGEIDRSILTSKIPLKDSSGKVVGLVGINRDITEVQRANASLEKERTLLLTLIESIPDEICLKETAHRFVVANSAVVKALGVRSVDDLLGKTDLDFTSPELAQMHFAEEDAIMESGEPMINGERIRRDPVTGEIEKCLLTTKVPVRDQAGKKIGILVVNRYVTDRKRAEEALRASEEKFRELFEESKDVVYISTADGRLLDINPAGIELFGYSSKEEFLLVDLTRCYTDPGEKERFDRQMEKQGFIKDCELDLKRADGKKLTVLETATAVRDKNGKIVQYRGIIRDVTSQRLLEHQFLQAQKMESIGTLAGGIAHDFNNILGIILGHLALLERTRENETQFEESIFSINKAVERGASLVRQILTFARKAETQLEPMNINSAVKELAKMLQETFPKTLAVTLLLDKTIPVVSMDPTQLHQTLLNLCVNARDAMNGQGTLTIVTHLVLGRDVSSRFPKATADHYIQVSVKDTGTGMDEETKQRIFEPFFTTKEEGKGTGLGLAVVYGVLQAHNGFIDVETAPGAGTTFHLFFPVPEGILTISEKQTGPQEYLPRGTETILVVEDEDVLRDLLVRLLEMQGYTVISACDGEEAVKRFSEHADEIDLVLSDMGLPKRSGWDAFRMMQRIDSNVRTLLASGYVEPGQKSEILKSGVMRFIHKPYKMEEILIAVRETLDYGR